MGPARLFSERDRQRGRTVLNIGFKDSASVLDYNAHRVGLPVDKPFVCNNQAFASLEAMAEATGRERHGIEIRDYDEVFATAEEPEHAPSNEGRLYQADQSRPAAETRFARSLTRAAACRGSTTISRATRRTWGPTKWASRCRITDPEQ